MWSNEFNIQTERSQGGHRRYFKENIEELKAIKEKIYVQKWMVFLYIPIHKNRISIVFTGGIGNE